jgi:D-mannonate dehydratase
MGKQLEDAGLAFSAMPGSLPLCITGDGAEATKMLDNVRRSMESMAAVNTKIITFPPLNGNTPWTQIVAFYGKLTEQAEKYGLKLATQTHGFFRTYDTISRLLKDVPSASNGFTFCTGNMWHGEGEKIYDLTRQLKDRIFFMHIRNVKTGLGEKEFWLDEGDIDYPKFMKVLKEINYRYDLRSEHLPTDHYGQPMASDLSSAWSLGYLKALIQTV